MEALAAIGLASSIITFIDAGAKVISMAQQIQSSYFGVTEENAELTLCTQRIKEQAGVLLKSPIAPDPFEAGLIERANECVALSDDLQHLLEKLKSAKPGSKTATLKALGQNLVKKDKKIALKRRLDDCRHQLEHQLIIVDG